VNINAYHQPGVEAGKKVAGNVLTLQRQIIACLKSNLNQRFTAFEISQRIGQEDEAEMVFKIVEHLAANRLRGIRKKSSNNVFESSYKMV